MESPLKEKDHNVTSLNDEQDFPLEDQNDEEEKESDEISYARGLINMFDLLSDEQRKQEPLVPCLNEKCNERINMNMGMIHRHCETCVLPYCSRACFEVHLKSGTHQRLCRFVSSDIWHRAKIIDATGLYPSCVFKRVPVALLANCDVPPGQVVFEEDPLIYSSMVSFTEQTPKFFSQGMEKDLRMAPEHRIPHAYVPEINSSCLAHHFQHELCRNRRALLERFSEHFQVSPLPQVTICTANAALDRTVRLIETNRMISRAPFTLEVDQKKRCADVEHPPRLSFLAYVCSKINHSCLPTCLLVDVAGRLRVIAGPRGLVRGNEITIPYEISREIEAQPRKRELLNSHHFVCVCQVCKPAPQTLYNPQNDQHLKSFHWLFRCVRPIHHLLLMQWLISMRFCDADAVSSAAVLSKNNNKKPDHLSLDTLQRLSEVLDGQLRLLMGHNLRLMHPELKGKQLEQEIDQRFFMNHGDLPQFAKAPLQRIIFQLLKLYISWTSLFVFLLRHQRFGKPQEPGQPKFPFAQVARDLLSAMSFDLGLWLITKSDTTSSANLLRSANRMFQRQKEFDHPEQPKLHMFQGIHLSVRVVLLKLMIAIDTSSDSPLPLHERPPVQTAVKEVWQVVDRDWCRPGFPPPTLFFQHLHLSPFLHRVHLLLLLHQRSLVSFHPTKKTIPSPYPRVMIPCISDSSS